MRFVFDPLRLALFVFLLLVLLVVIQLEIAAFAFAKLGVPPLAAVLLLGASLAGSLVNVPLLRVTSRSDWLQSAPVHARYLLRLEHPYGTDQTIVCVNLGGCIIPVLLSVWLVLATPLPAVLALAGVSMVAVVSYLLSRPIRGLGIGMPILAAPLVAALVAMVFGGEDAAALAYVSGTCGVLVGADLLRLPDVRRLAVPVASIGGAGTFDGIFITGVLATLIV